MCITYEVLKNEEPLFSTWTGQPLIVNGDLYRFGFCTSFVNFLPLDARHLTHEIL